MTKEDIKDIAVKGLFLGLILFLSTLVNLLIYNDKQHLKIVWNFLIPILIAYSLLGMFIKWMRYRSTTRKKEGSLFSGAAIVIWIWIFTTVVMIGAYWIPQVIRYTVIANVITLMLVWYLDCLYLKKVAKELNSGLGYKRRTLVEDLTERPATEDMFMEEIENYCNKNSLSLEVIEYGIPAKIKMNNTLYVAKLGQYYSMLGTPVYTLEFHNIVSRTSASVV